MLENFILFPNTLFRFYLIEEASKVFNYSNDKRKNLILILNLIMIFCPITVTASLLHVNPPSSLQRTVLSFTFNGMPFNLKPNEDLVISPCRRLGFRFNDMPLNAKLRFFRHAVKLDQKQ